MWPEKGENADVKDYCEKLQELNKGIKEWEDKREEMTRRFDEELALIRPAQSISSMAPTVADGGKTCPGCGMPVADDDMFCQGCGKKLQ